MLHRWLYLLSRAVDDLPQVEQQEGLLRYHPFLFPDSRQFVTLNQTVFGLDRVFVTPAIIESTTLVLATGLDVFFMRATPSKVGRFLIIAPLLLIPRSSFFLFFFQILPSSCFHGLISHISIQWLAGWLAGWLVA